MAVLKRPIKAFCSTTTANVLNILTKDLSYLDDSIPRLLLYALENSVLIIGAVILACVINIWIIFVVLPLAIIFVFLNKFYLKTFQKLFWLEEVNRGAVLNHFSETMQGLVTIRAAEKEKEFTNILYRLVVCIFCLRYPYFLLFYYIIYMFIYEPFFSTGNYFCQISVKRRR